MAKKIMEFLQRDVWRIPLKNVSGARSFAIRNLRVILLALRGFNEDKCSLRASALTFYTLLSIVPVLAMAFGIAKGFGLEKILEAQLLERIPAQNELISNIINFSHNLLESTKGGLVAGAGVALLFWTVVKVLGTIERSFNDIWGIKIARSPMRMFTDYLSIMVICPVLLIVSSSATVFIGSQAQVLAGKITLLGTLGPAVRFLLGFLPYTVMWFVFSFIYVFIPNTKVNLKSGVLAGILIGTAYQCFQWIYVYFQVGVAKYNAIYGSFAALPLFLVWLQTSWRLVLLGAEVSFAHQNVDTYEFEPDCLRIRRSFKTLLSLRVASLLARNFSTGAAPLSAYTISHESGIPMRLVRDIVYELTQAGIISTAMTDTGRIPLYQPARDIHTLTIRFVIDALDNYGTDAIPVVPSHELESIRSSLGMFEKITRESSANVLLKDL